MNMHRRFLPKPAKPRHVPFVLEARGWLRIADNRWQWTAGHVIERRGVARWALFAPSGQLVSARYTDPVATALEAERA